MKLVEAVKPLSPIDCFLKTVFEFVLAKFTLPKP